MPEEKGPYHLAGSELLFSEPDSNQNIFDMPLGSVVQHQRYETPTHKTPTHKTPMLITYPMRPIT